MNFKDIYKSANDDIHADRQLLDEILNGKAEKKPRNIKPMYAYGYVAAAFVVVITLFAYQNIGKYLNETPQTTNMPKSATITDTDSDIGQGESDTDNTQIPAVDNRAAKDSSANTQIPAADKRAKDSSVNTQIPAADNRAKDSTAAEHKEHKQVMQEQKMPMPDAENAVEQQLNDIIEDASFSEIYINHVEPDSFAHVGSPKSAMMRSSAAGGPMAARVVPEMEITSHFESVTASEYCDYLGLDILERIELPHDITLNTDSTILIEKSNESNEVLADTATFDAYSVDNPSRYVSVITSKMSDSAASCPIGEDYAKSFIAETPAVILFDGARYCAYITIGDVNIAILTQTVTEEEIADIIKSLI